MIEVNRSNCVGLNNADVVAGQDALQWSAKLDMIVAKGGIYNLTGFARLYFLVEIVALNRTVNIVRFDLIIKMVRSSSPADIARVNVVANIPGGHAIIELVELTCIKSSKAFIKRIASICIKHSCNTISQLNN